MEISSKPRKESLLYKKGQALIKAAYEYWKEYQETNEPGAVVWLKDTSGCMVLFTRGEYSQDIMRNIEPLSDEHPLINPFEIIESAE